MQCSSPINSNHKKCCTRREIHVYCIFKIWPGRPSYSKVGSVNDWTNLYPDSILYCFSLYLFTGQWFTQWTTIFNFWTTIARWTEHLRQASMKGYHVAVNAVAHLWHTCQHVHFGPILADDVEQLHLFQEITINCSVWWLWFWSTLQACVTIMELALYHMSYLAKFQWIVFHTGARQFQ